ncbi:MAG: hypothetical protein ABIZ50_01625, partial [Solirubrobacterales bacterium]
MADATDQRFRIPRGIALCGAVMLAGAALCAVGALRISGVDDRIAGYPAIAAGTSGTIELTDSGSYVGFFELANFGQGEKERSSDAPTLDVEAPDGRALPIDVYGGDDTATPEYSPGDFLSYEHGDYGGAPVYSFDVPAAGTYQVDVGASPKASGRIRIGPGISGQMIGGIILAAAGAVIGGIALLTILAWGVSLL